MKKLLLLLFIPLLFACSKGDDDNVNPAPADPSSLIGTWKVALIDTVEHRHYDNGISTTDTTISEKVPYKGKELYIKFRQDSAVFNLPAGIKIYTTLYEPLDDSLLFLNMGNNTAYIIEKSNDTLIYNYYNFSIYDENDIQKDWYHCRLYYIKTSNRYY